MARLKGLLGFEQVGVSLTQSTWAMRHGLLVEAPRAL